MTTPFTTWADAAPELIDVAMGRSPAATVIRNGRWVNVHSGEVVPGTDVAIVAGRFAWVGPDARHAVGEDTTVIDAAGRFLVPGLCDAHMHVESGMVTVTEFARAVVPHGTTTMFIDPHEIANVLGLMGVRLMHDEAAGLPINVFVQMPSCVPSAPGLENGGAVLGPDDVQAAMGWPEHHRARRDDELSRRRRRGREDAGRDRRHPEGGQDRRRPLRLARSRPSRSTRTRRPGPPMIMKERGSRTASPGFARACAPCCGSARRGTTWRTG